jgi:hypothetical protein
MANNIPPELLMQLFGQQYRAPSSGSGWSQGPTDANRNFTAGNGDTWHTTYDTSGSNAEGYNAPNTATGYLRDSVAGKSGVGDSQEIYDTYGQYIATGQIPPDTSFKDFLMMAAMVAGPFAAGMSPSINAAMSFGTNPVMGAGGAGGAGSGMVNGAFLGEAPWAATGGGALDFGGAAAGGGSAAGGMGNGAFLGEAPWTATAGGGAMPGGFGTATATAGTSLLDGGIKSLLGPAATVLGGIAGAQGGDDERSTTKDVPEWLKPYVTKNLEYAGGLLDKQMQPGYLQGYDDMRSRGQSLLNAPMAGNGFSRFFGSK